MDWLEKIRNGNKLIKYKNNTGPFLGTARKARLNHEDNLFCTKEYLPVYSSQQGRSSNGHGGKKQERLAGFGLQWPIHHLQNSMFILLSAGIIIIFEISPIDSNWNRSNNLIVKRL